MKLGLDIISEEKFSKLKGKNFGLLCNPASVDSNYQHILSLLERNDLQPTTLFGPEHGLKAAAQDMISVSGEKIGKTRVVSLYGETQDSLKPTISDFKNLDILLVDLQDVGSRYYTYAQTMYFCMQTAAKAKTKVIVLDRPNPLGGKKIEGAELSESCKSFCGIAPVANQHGLTLGELALLYNKGAHSASCSVEAASCELEIIELKDWKREQYSDDCQHSWVMPSPNMPTLHTAIVYPGACLFEATEMSEGRGSTRPFELIGAPFIDSKRWIAATLEDEGVKIEGAVLRPVDFIPQFQKLSGENCSGVQIHVTNRKTFQAFRLGLALISSAYKLYPQKFSWKKGTYEFIDNIPAIDLLYGSDKFRKCLEAGGVVGDLLGEIEEFEVENRKMVSEFWIYSMKQLF